MPTAQIPVLLVPDDLATLLHMPLAELYSAVYKAKYRTSFVPKKSGGYRTIQSPAGKLAKIQRDLAAILSTAYGSRVSVHGFAKKRGIRTNANAHRNAVQIFTCDIQDFFPSIHFGRVRGLFSAKPYGYSKDVAQLLARICCHKGSLPQGAPTSPILSNMICGKLDSDLKHLARQHGCCYTRYADDLSFSTQQNNFPKALVDKDATGAVIPGGVLAALLNNAHFSINPLKTRLMASGGRREVTGVVIGSKGLNIRRSMIRQIRCMLHAWENNGIDLAAQEFLSKYDSQKRAKVDFAAVVRGKIDHLGHVRGRDNEVYARLFERYLKLVPHARRKSIEITSSSDVETRLRAVYVLKGITDDGHELLSTAFWLRGVGLVTANHAVRNLNGDKYKQLIIYKKSEALDGIEVQISKASQHHDLAILVAAQPYKPLVEFVQASPPSQGAMVTLLGYPHYNPGNPASITNGQIVRQQVLQAINQLVISCVINEGNSGGPLLDRDHRVIGIATKGASLTENIAVVVSDLTATNIVP